jgi:hypothetical protein
MGIGGMTYFPALLELISESLTPDIARRVLAIRVDPAIHSRIGELAEKANEGLLSEHERAEYSEYVEVSDLFAILEVKARLLLNDHQD